MYMYISIYYVLDLIIIFIITHAHVQVDFFCLCAYTDRLFYLIRRHIQVDFFRYTHLKCKYVIPGRIQVDFFGLSMYILICRPLDKKKEGPNGPLL